MGSITSLLFLVVILSNTETVKCKVCPEAPSWGLWTAWSKCSATCNKIGTRFRGRDCIQSDCPDGSPCIGEWREEHSCYGPCVTPEGGTRVSEWSEWSECVGECFQLGKMYRKRECLNQQPYPQLRRCYSRVYEEKVCRKSCCKEGEPAWSKWTKWTSCEPSCGLGTQNRSRECQGEDLCVKYTICPGEPNEQRRCFTWCCGEENVKLGQWTPWGSCSEDNCKRIRTRTCTANKCEREAEQCADLKQQVRK